MNVILSFLSPIHINPTFNKDKKPIKYDIGYAKYEDIAGDGLGDTHSTNESGLRYFLQKLGEENRLDAYIALASNKYRTEQLVAKDKLEKLEESARLEALKTFSKTHQQYFEERFDEILNKYGYTEGAKELIKNVDYNENGTRQDAIKSVMDAVHRINELRLQNNKFQPVNLYLDISGGMRDANMLILIISRILENNDGIKLKKVVYSNFDAKNKIGEVETMTDVYKLLDLVSGVNEFLNFGSMKTLNEYFEQDSVRSEVGSELKALLEAMTGFTEKVQLCHATVFEDAIKSLKNSLDAFEKYYGSQGEQEHTITEKLFYGLLESIKAKYILLFENSETTNKKYLQYISWCYENGYLQQSLTMITELFPHIFLGEEEDVKDALVKLTDAAAEELKEMFAQQKEKDDKLEKYPFINWLMYVYNAYNNKDFELDKNWEEKLNGIIKEMLISIRSRKYQEKASIFKNKICKLATSLEKWGTLNYTEPMRDLEDFYTFVMEKEGLKKRILELDEQNSIFQFIFNFIASDLPNCKKEGTPVNYILKELSSGKYHLVKYFDFSICNEKKAAFHRNAKPIISLMRNKKLEPCIKAVDISKLEMVINDFYVLKAERNTTNHASMGHKDIMSYKELKDTIKRFVENLKEIYGLNKESIR